MTHEDKQKLAEKIAEKAMSAKNVTYAVVLQAVYEALNARDEEMKQLRDPWISVEERLPEKTRNLSPFPDEYDEKVVLVINEQGGKRLAYRDYKWVWRDDYTCEIVNQNYARITHWMPIPETHLNR